jgi:hypothetical protein
MRKPAVFRAATADSESVVKASGEDEMRETSSRYWMIWAGVEACGW